MQLRIFLGVLAGFALLGAGCARSTLSPASEVPAVSEVPAATEEAASPAAPAVPEAETPKAPAPTSAAPAAAPAPAKTVTPFPLPAPKEDVVAKTLATTPKAQTVSMTAGSFSPSTLTITKGTTVTFLNNDTKAWWPASGVHPTHQLCPGFDALGPVAPGEKYSFTFVQAKTCPMHDHLSPGVRGTIIVIE